MSKQINVRCLQLINVKKLEYLIRDALDRECPPLIKRDEATNVFQNNQQQQNPSKRLRTSPKDDEQHHSSIPQNLESTTNIRDPFTLQPHSKSQHHESTSTTNSDKIWQSVIQQPQYHLQFPSRSSRTSGSITQGSPISPSLRLTTDQQQYSSATNNQLVNPRYSHYMNKNNEQQSSPSTSPHDHSPKAKIAKRSNQPISSPSDAQQESSGDHSSSLKTSTTPPMIASPPTSSSSAHSLKKRLISEYELEQQRNSPVVPPPVEENVEIPKNDTEETVPKPTEETENST